MGEEGGEGDGENYLKFASATSVPTLMAEHRYSLIKWADVDFVQLLPLQAGCVITVGIVYSWK